MTFLQCICSRCCKVPVGRDLNWDFGGLGGVYAVERIGVKVKYSER